MKSKKKRCKKYKPILNTSSASVFDYLPENNINKIVNKAGWVMISKSNYDKIKQDNHA